MAFDYEVRLASDPERPAGDNKIGGTSKATSRAVQSACDAGAPVDSFTPDIELLENRTVSVDSGLNAAHGIPALHTGVEYRRDGRPGRCRSLERQ